MTVDTDLFASTTENDADTMATLHRRLEHEAAGAGVLDVAYRYVDTPIGRLLLATTEEGLVRIAFERESDDDVLDSMASRISPRILHAPDRLDAVARQLEEYFDRRRTTFDLDVDLRLATDFRRNVLTHLLEVPYGKTVTYKQLAEAAGTPKAIRAAGSACATNPIPIVVPCHRVLPTNAKRGPSKESIVGNYGGGVETKVTLLTLEGRFLC